MELRDQGAASAEDAQATARTIEMISFVVNMSGGAELAQWTTEDPRKRTSLGLPHHTSRTGSLSTAAVYAAPSDVANHQKGRCIFQVKLSCICNGEFSAVTYVFEEQSGSNVKTQGTRYTKYGVQAFSCNLAAAI